MQKIRLTMLPRVDNERVFQFFFLLFCLSSFNPASSLEQTSDRFAPEMSSGSMTKQRLVQAKKYMVATAHPLASQAAEQVLSRGGHAMDALVTAQFILGLVEPQSSGLGGGGFVVYYDSLNKTILTFDGRETAPLAANDDLFLTKKSGEPMDFFDAVVGGRSVGTPGMVKLLGELNKRYGKKTWFELLQPSIALAEHGFAVSARLSHLIDKDQQLLRRYQSTRKYFLDKLSRPIPIGHNLKNPAYAKTVRFLAKQGYQAFYEPKFAGSIVKSVNNAKGNPGMLSLKDFNAYQIKERQAICSSYRKVTVCGMGPPSSGAIAVNQILGMLNHFDLSSLGSDSPIAWQLIGDATRLAFADRARYVADSDFVVVPIDSLLDHYYLQERASLLNPGRALKDIKPGVVHSSKLSDKMGESLELPSTTHISIVDNMGNAVSMTSSIENRFGSRLMVNGFLLNNQLTDFSFVSKRDGARIANRVEPGKRPRSSMSPTIVLKNKKPLLVLGSPGGSRIISYVVKTIVAYLDWGLDIQSAINLPNAVNRFGIYELEVGTRAETLQQSLNKVGFDTKRVDLNSGIQAIAIEQNGLFGGADPRREGVVLGQ